MRRVLTCLLAVVGLVAIHGTAKANPVGFVGYYAPANWTVTLSPGTNGSVDWSGAPASAIVIGTDNSPGGNTDVEITIPGGGFVNFNWDYVTTDADGAFFDPFGYLLNGTFVQLSDDNGPPIQGGFASVAVQDGDVFGFRQNSLDGAFGGAQTTISQFDAPNPEPMSMIIFGGLTVAGIVGCRRKMKTA
jgi:hypothetical protein